MLFRKIPRAIQCEASDHIVGGHHKILFTKSVTRSVTL